MSAFGPERTSLVAPHMAAFDPKRTCLYGAKARICLGLSIVVNRTGATLQRLGASGQLAKRRRTKRKARKRAEQDCQKGEGLFHLSPQRDRVRLILETALDAVVIMKSDGIVADWNDRAMSVFGWSRDEAVGRTMADLVIPERYREAHRKGLRRYLETGKVIGRRIEVSGLRKTARNFLSSYRSHQFKMVRAFSSSVACVTLPNTMRCVSHD